MNRIKALRTAHVPKMSQEKLAHLVGVGRTTVTMWENGSNEPDNATVVKLAEIFGVSTDYILGRDVKENAPTLTKKDERDIARDLEAFIADMDQGDLMFDGDPMTPEARESVIAAMKLGLEAAKMKNKERFTPKKYRKDTPDR